MKRKAFMRIFAVMMAALVMMGGFSVSAYAGGGEDEENTLPAETAEVEEQEQVEETTGGYEPEALTPEGNLTLVDDISGETSGDKQFITVTTRNGNYFYIIIDRAEDGENTVHFLNQVDEADLLAILEELGIETMQTVTVEPEPEPETTAEPEPEVEPEEENGGMGNMVIIVLVLALGGGGAFYYFKVMKPKQSVKGGDDLDDYDFEDDEDEETEFEVFEDEQEDE